MASPASRDLLQLLANPTNRTILSVLSLEPQYPRRLAELVGLTEDEASRRLRMFEKAGLAAGTWANVGKNVRLYRLATSRLTVTVGPDGLAVAGLPGDRRLTVGPAAEMPPSLEHFVGRDDELAAIETLLAQRRAVAVVGIGGAGKTAVAAAYARRSGRPVAWHTLAVGESDVLLLARLATSVRAVDATERGQQLVTLRDADDPSVLLRAILESANASGALIVLDRLETMGDGALEAVAGLARGLTDARLLVTSRAFPPGLPRDLVANYRLPGLSSVDAERLLHAFGAKVRGEAVQAIHERTHGHPLSLVLVSQVADEARGSRVERLMEESGIRDFLIEDVVPQLPEPERELLFCLSVLRGPFAVHDAEAVSGSRHAAHTLLRLEARGLVSRAGDTFQLHDLVRSFVAEAAPNRRVLHGRAAKLLASSGEPAAVLEAVHHYLEAGAVAEAGGVVTKEATQRPFRFLDHGLAAPYQEVLGRLMAHDRVDPLARAAAAVELALVVTFAGDADQARALLETAEKATTGKGAVLRLPLLIARGRVLRLEGKHEEALDAYRQAEREAEAAKAPNHLLEALVERGYLEEERSDAAALEVYRRAMDLAKQSSDIRCLCLAYAGAARITLRQGDDSQMAWAEEALRLARMSGYLRGEVSVYMALATHAIVTGRFRSDESLIDRYLEVANRLGDPWLLACAINDKAILLLSMKMYREALALSDDYLGRARAIRSPFYVLAAQVCRAEALRALDRPEEALDALADGLQEQVDAWPLLASRAWRLRAEVLERLGRTGDAEQARAQWEAWAKRGTTAGDTGYEFVALYDEADPKPRVRPERAPAKRRRRARR